MSRALFAVGVAVAAAVAFLFLLLPLLAIFLQVPVRELVGAFGNQAAQDALVVSLKTSAIAHAAVLVFGTPTAYLLARRRFRGRGAVLTLVELPLVLPPAVAGIGLLVAFGRFGLLGEELSALGIEVGFTQTAVVLAVAFVESPFYLRGAIAAFEAVDRDLIAAARTLGAGPWRVFSRIAIPLAAGGLGAASALALARGLGEFGATIIFAGSLQGMTLDAAARHLRPARPGPRRCARNQRALRRRGCGRPRRTEGLHMGTLRFDLTVPVRHFDVG